MAKLQLTIIGLLYCFCTITLCLGALPGCNRNVLKLSDMDDVNLVLQLDGSFKFKSKLCVLKEYTAYETKACLKNNNIVFLGDSLTRYTYLSLAYLIANDKKLPNFAFSTNNSYPPNIAWEKDFKTWERFHIHSNYMLNNISTHSYELCDCYRYDLFTESTENRYFRTYVDNALLSLTMLVFYNKHPTHYLKAFLKQIPKEEAAYKDFVQRLTYELCVDSHLQPLSSACYHKLHVLSSDKENVFNNHFYSDQNGAFEREILFRLNITHMIVNIGHHGTIHHDGDWKDTETRVASQLKWLYTRLQHTDHYQPSSEYLRNISKLIWKDSFARAPGGPYNDQLVRRVYHNITSPSNTSANLAIMSGYKITDKLKSITQKFKGLTDIQRIRHDYFELSNEILRDMELLNIVKKGNNPYYVHIPPVYLDHAHLQPWFYNEVNNFMLNAIC